ncbi:MAG: bifunctional riboflavin kinase/FAD synthetase [Sulfuricellaceae bacterium]|nr:bifunctional riboflavin kinase/FAD synthetase [Sulfuricellaceae bacterium]
MLIYRGIPAHSDTPVALTIGNFDGIHLGHQAMLARLVKAARELRLPSCVMTFEPHPREVFTPEAAPARLTSLREKLELLADYGVDRTYILRFNRQFAQLGADDFIRDLLYRRLQARWVLIGDDFRFGAKRAGDLHLLEQLGGELGIQVASMHSIVHDELRVSSTAVREALADGQLELAARLLGRPYSISGRVVHGDKAGREFGYPTANIQLKHNKPPLAGIFAVKLCGLDGTELPGAASLGIRPTVKQNGKPTLEVHVFDFDRQIYGEHVRVDFYHKLRDEKKFAGLDELIAAIGQDVKDAKAFFLNR